MARANRYGYKKGTGSKSEPKEKWSDKWSFKWNTDVYIDQAKKMDLWEEDARAEKGGYVHYVNRERVYKVLQKRWNDGETWKSDDEIIAETDAKMGESKPKTATAKKSKVEDREAKMFELIESYEAKGFSKELAVQMAIAVLK